MLALRLRSLLLALGALCLASFGSLLLLGSQFPPLAGGAGAAAAASLPQPAPEQKLLEAYEGTWDAHVKFMFGAETSMLESTGVEVDAFVCNKLWMTSQFDSDKKSPFYQGRGLFGYDPPRKKFFGAWGDMVIPTLTLLDGEFSKDGRTFTLTGQVPDYKKPGAAATARIVTEFNPEKGTRKMTQYVKGADGVETVFMTADYKKKRK